ncbi:MAG: histidine kinase, partial [Chloroflexota bacterium]|nr:histidine kinase [Chloroflexota bacterium]
LAGFALMGDSPPPNQWAILRWAGLTLIPLVPAIAAARPSTPAALADGTSPSGRLVESNELIFVGLTPGVAAMAMTFPDRTDPFVLPILLWIAALLVAARFTVRPLVRLATRANLQRDLVVAAMEAERARLAADLHDDALQDLTLLVRRLDAAGDTEGAAQARAVADRLREICGDLRLPILDDLGVGPALDWLVLRIERLAGGEVRLERAEGDRPPADVELAFFRVAQEALANAVKHGRPPIVVRYRASPSGASLSVDDAGAGIAPEAREEAATGGHFGLLNMQQRAEQIGAILDVRRWPAGGTHVALEWRAR